MNRRGFTVVELLIVIVVIAILAATTVVAFNGIKRRADDTARYAELVQVDRLIRLYRVQNGSYPVTDMTPGKITCIGTEFPTGYCWDGASQTDQSVTNALKTVGNVPSGKLSITNYGTHIWIIDANSFELNGVFEDINCPKGFEQTESYAGHTQCIKIYYINEPV